MKKKKTEVDKVNEREQNLDRQTDRQTDRVVFFDWLRIIATLAVVVIHCCSKESLEVASYEWNTVHFYNCLSQWAVPAFVMISGALFLGREITLSKLFKKSIFRIGTAFLFWSVLYACWRFFVTHEKNSIREMVLSIIKGHYHMWFLFLIVGLYLVVPLLNKIVENQKLAVYFVVLAFLFAFLFPQIINVVGLKFEGPASILNEFISKFRVEMVLGYAGYFVLGYLLAQVRINKRAEALRIPSRSSCRRSLGRAAMLPERSGSAAAQRAPQSARSSSHPDADTANADRVHRATVREAVCAVHPAATLRCR